MEKYNKNFNVLVTYFVLLNILMQRELQHRQTLAQKLEECFKVNTNKETSMNAQQLILSLKTPFPKLIL
jgi:hypothetical protein